MLALERGESRTSQTSGYIELFSDGRHSAFDQLRAFFAVLYDREALPVAPHVWTQVERVRYLTSDAAAGAALPLYSFNPQVAGRPPETLNDALERLERVTHGALARANVIGLTVDFDFTVEAEKLRAALARAPETTRSIRAAADVRANINRVLFGESLPAADTMRRRFDIQDVALSGGVGALMKNAMCELCDDAQASRASTPVLDYGVAETGQGVIVGVVDFGCDFAHASFCDADRRHSRVLALWDQNEGLETDLGPAIVASEPPFATIGGERCAFGFGRVFKKEAIDKVLQQWRDAHAEDRQWPYGALGYDPHHHHYLAKPPIAAHGTCVLDIAAGRERQWVTDGSDRTIVKGVASGADLVFVQIRTHLQDDGRRILDANDVVDGVAFIFHLAEERGQPCVVNLSLNTMSGPHDGDGHFERRLSNLLRSGSAGADMKGRAVVVAAGNLPDKGAEWRQWQHIADTVTPGQPFAFFWNLSYASDDKTRNSLEIWYDAPGAWLQVTLSHEALGVVATVNPGSAAELLANGKIVGSIIGSRARPAIEDNADLKRRADTKLPDDDQSPNRHVILVTLDPHIEGAVYWKISLAIVDASNTVIDAAADIAVPFHAWLERDDEGQTGIARQMRLPTPLEPADRQTSIGTLSCGTDSIVVAAYDASRAQVDLSPMSASGPTRKANGRKPDLSAPGVDLKLILSKSDTGRVLQSGTSLAAPFVAGAIACLYEAAPHADLAAIKTALVQTGRRNIGEENEAGWSEQLGWGRLSPVKAVDWLKQRNV
ncbi:MAG: S8 family serine peptidase [Variibacter sp.]